MTLDDFSHLHGPTAPTKSPEQSTSSSGNSLHGDGLTLANELSGREFHIPAMWNVFSDWPVAKSNHHKTIQRYADMLLEKYVSSPKRLKVLKKADFAGLVAFWYSLSDLPELEMMTTFMLWLFIWDDEVDTNGSLISSDAERAHAYSQKSIEYIRQELDLPTKSENETVVEDKPKIAINEIPPNMLLFREVARRLSGTDIAQRQQLYEELADYINSAEAEHIFRLRGTIPSSEEYMRVRSGSVGCRAFMVLTDFMLKFRLPEAMINSEPMQSLWNVTNTICYLVNDLYSVQKEIAEGSVLNIVPVLYWNGQNSSRDLGKVACDIVAMIRESMETFDTAAECLRKSAAGDAQLSSQIASFIQVCRYFNTGQVAWYGESPRYGMAELFHKDGSATFVLKPAI